MSDEPLIELDADDIRWSLDVLDDEPNHLAMTDEDVLVSSLSEAESYRILAQRAIAALHDLTVKHDRLRETHQRNG